MPEKSQIVPADGADVATILTWAYGTLERLEWNIKYAGDNVLIGYTSGEWNFKGEEITLVANNNELNITSKMVHGETVDIFARNKKHIQAFKEAFESVKTSASPVQLSAWQDKIILLKEETTHLAAEEISQAEEMNKGHESFGR